MARPGSVGGVLPGQSHNLPKGQPHHVSNGDTVGPSAGWLPHHVSPAGSTTVVSAGVASSAAAVPAVRKVPVAAAALMVRVAAIRRSVGFTVWSVLSIGVWGR